MTDSNQPKILPREPMKDADLEAALHAIHRGFLRLLDEGDAGEILKLEMNLRGIFLAFRQRLEERVAEASRVN